MDLTLISPLAFSRAEFRCTFSDTTVHIHTGRGLQNYYNMSHLSFSYPLCTVSLGCHHG